MQIATKHAVSSDAKRGHRISSDLSEKVTQFSSVSAFVCVCVCVCVSVCVCVLVAQSYLTLCDPTDYSLSGSSVRGILQARTLEWVAMPFSREPSIPRE